MGRPSTYSEDIASAICEALAEGKSLRAICAADDMPAASTVFLWLDKHPTFSEQYARAREIQADTKFDEAWDIADKATAENVQVARLKVDTIKWQTSKLAPKKYGEKVTQEHTGPNGSELPAITVKFVAPDA